MTLRVPPLGYKAIKEGISSILIPENGSVFYNPVQEFNRDLSVAVIRLYGQKMSQEKKNFQGLQILDALTASGFRAIRYAHQVPTAKRIVANDLNTQVKDTLQHNLQFNQVPEMLVELSFSDANALLYASRAQPTFSVIDIDPYGSASPFLDAAVQGLTPGGLLCVTCTDMAVLCGVYPETCFAKYQGIPLHTDYAQEMAIRLVLSSIETAANRYGKYIEPLLSTRIDFYVRVFVRIHIGPAQVKMAVTKKSHIAACAHCKSFITLPLGFMTPHVSKKGKKKRKYTGRMLDKEMRETKNGDMNPEEEMDVTRKGITEEEKCNEHPNQEGEERVGIENESNKASHSDVESDSPMHPSHYHYGYPILTSFSSTSQCETCDGPMQLAGPIWSAPLHQKEFIRDLLRELDQIELGTRERLEGFLNLLLEELEVPLYLTIPHLSRVLKSTSPPLVIFKSALLNAGYKVSISHTHPLGIKTNAPSDYLWAIMKAWYQTQAQAQNENENEKESKDKASNHSAIGSVSARILAKPLKYAVDLTLHAAATAESKEKRLLRFQLPPCENWGPRAKAKSIKSEQGPKSKQEQGPKSSN